MESKAKLLIEKLKLIYQPKINEAKPEPISDKSTQLINENHNIINEKNKENIQNKIGNHIEETKKSNLKEEEEKNDNNINININNNVPKKLDFGKIFKDKNFEKISSMIKESKRQEIIKVAQQQKEESLRMTKDNTENDSGDSLDASDEEKEKEEEIQEIVEEDKNFQFEILPNFEDFKGYDEGEKIEEKEVKKEGLMSKVKNKFSNFNIFKSDKNQKTEQKMKTNHQNTLEEKNTISNANLEKQMDVINEENPRKMRKTISFMNQKQNSSSPVDDDTFLQCKIVSKNEKSKNDNFCESLFLASFSKEDCKIMENSDNIEAESNNSN